MGEDIAAALAAPLTALSLVPIEATVTTAGTRRVLRVLVDRDVSRLDAADASSPVDPLTLDEVADATRVVGDTPRPASTSWASAPTRWRSAHRASVGH